MEFFVWTYLVLALSNVVFSVFTYKTVKPQSVIVTQASTKKNAKSTGILSIIAAMWAAYALLDHYGVFV